MVFLRRCLCSWSKGSPGNLGRDDLWSCNKVFPRCLSSCLWAIICQCCPRAGSAIEVIHRPLWPDQTGWRRGRVGKGKPKVGWFQGEDTIRNILTNCQFHFFSLLFFEAIFYSECVRLHRLLKFILSPHCIERMQSQTNISANAPFWATCIIMTKSKNWNNIKNLRRQRHANIAVISNLLRSKASICPIPLPPPVISTANNSDNQINSPNLSLISVSSFIS